MANDKEIGDKMDYTYYINKLSESSATYKKFVRDYIVERAMIAGRGEEDILVWNKLKNDELETAKQFILNQLKENPQMPYIRAVGFFRDERAIPLLKNIIDAFPEKWIVEKLFAAKILYDWVGYKDYVPRLEAACNNRTDKMLYDCLKVSINQFVDSLEEIDRLKIMKALTI